METVTLFGGFGGIIIGQELLGTVPTGVWPSIKTIIPSPGSGGPFNVMNVLSMTLLALEGFSNIMNVPTSMIGAFFVQKLGKCMELCCPTNNYLQQTIFSNQTAIANLI